ncbi:hypothetical protein [Aurantiacibacter hainanensis]|uniref:hypothetical protein n=1 Tax=Aurantiacibacter hainanensis TaxID=3076114 RepID=UPI0030C73170
MDDRGPTEAQSRQRFMLINFMRIAGVVMILAGVAVFNDALPLPDWAGILLLVLGMVETFVTPTLLARIWSTNEKR